MSTPPGFMEARTALVQLSGGYLRNTIRESYVTCRTCTGPVDGYEYCPKCRNYSTDPLLADIVATVTYAREGHQSGHLMYNYKADQSAPDLKRLVTLLGAYAVMRHWGCLTNNGYGGISSWSTVPSLKKDRGYIHPLSNLLNGVISARAPYRRILRSVHVQNPRDARPENFEPECGPWGSHVLLIEDTWVGGGHAQGAAKALKLAGVDRVTVLALARWLDMTWTPTPEFVNSRLTRDFDPDICPLSGDYCTL
jgi:predicted amidophosphoribosyltransferase